MRILIIETTPRSKGNKAIDAHVRNSHILMDSILSYGHECDLVFCGEDLKRYINTDIAIISYSSKYKPYYKNLEAIKGAQCIWITNEYSISPNGIWEDYFQSCKNPIVVKNFERQRNIFGIKNIKNVFYNANAAAYKSSKSTRKKTHNIIYYGTYRPDRQKYFKKYLDENVYLSTSKKNMTKFKKLGISPKYINKLDWRNPILKSFRFSLYIEDEKTHRNYNCLADRFYEAVRFDTVILFDESCINTLEKSEITNYEQHIINKNLKYYDELDYDKLIKIQRKWMPLIEETRDKAKAKLGRDLFETQYDT